MKIEFEEVKKRYELIRTHLNSPKAPDLTPDEKALVEKYDPIDIQGWLISEVERLRASAAQ